MPSSSEARLANFMEDFDQSLFHVTLTCQKTVKKREVLEVFAVTSQQAGERAKEFLKEELPAGTRIKVLRAVVVKKPIQAAWYWQELKADARRKGLLV